MTCPMLSDALTGPLLRAQARAVEEWLARYLAAHGVDPDDRSLGWEERARAVLRDVEAVEELELTDGDPYRIVLTTTLRRREGS